MMLKAARPTVPPAPLYAPNMIAKPDVVMDATSQGLGKYFSRQIPNGINQPNTYQKLRSVRQFHRATKKLTGALAWSAMFHGHLSCPATTE